MTTSSGIFRTHTMATTSTKLHVMERIWILQHGKCIGKMLAKMKSMDLEKSENFFCQADALFRRTVTVR